MDVANCVGATISGTGDAIFITLEQVVRGPTPRAPAGEWSPPLRGAGYEHSRFDGKAKRLQAFFEGGFALKIPLADCFVLAIGNDLFFGGVRIRWQEPNNRPVETARK